jgi:hypothetical protein
MTLRRVALLFDNKARPFDFGFAAQRDGADRLRQERIGSNRWLPLACDHCGGNATKRLQGTAFWRATHMPKERKGLRQQ